MVGPLDGVDLSLIVVMFAVGVAAMRSLHQAGWLVASRRSLVEPKGGDRDARGTSAYHLGMIGSTSSYIDLVPDRAGDSRQSWMTDILPLLGFVFGGELRRDIPWDDARNSAYFKGIVPIYLNPDIGVTRSPEGYALSHYAANVHVLGPERASRGGVPRDAANTILAGEVAEGFRPCGDPANLRDPGQGVGRVPGAFGGPSGGANFVFMDGSVRFFSATTAPETLRKLSGSQR